MNNEAFLKQIERLRTQYGDKTYSKERVALFWKAFQHTEETVFVEAMDDLIANRRLAPMLEDLEKAVRESKNRDSERRNRSAALPVDFVETLQDAQKRTQDPQVREFASRCVGYVKDLTAVPPRLNRRQFEEACDLLDQTAEIMNPRNCSKCSEGYVFVEVKPGYEAVYRCHCAKGRVRQSEIRWSDGTIKQIPFAPVVQSLQSG